jgi:thiamine pyrophosphokinase
MTHEHSLIFIGGDAPHENALKHLPTDAYVIAADSGYEHALAFGQIPHALVGDMDSISPHHLADARARKIDIIEHPTHKDLTDTEIALQLAQSRKSVSVTIVSGGGDRFDHVLAMMHAVAFHATQLPTRAFLSAASLDFFAGPSTQRIQTTVGATMSLIPLGGDVHLSSQGLQWNLHDEALHAFASRGVSNIAISNEVCLELTHGIIAVVQPHYLTQGVPQ